MKRERMNTLSNHVNAMHDEMKDLKNGESVSSQEVLQGQLPTWQ